MKRTMKLAVIAAVSAMAVLTVGMTAFAAEYTTKDKVLTINTPDKEWKEFSDPNTWVTLGNGNDTITMMHYSNGESLPAPTVADTHYTKVYQTILSTRNEVFVVTGSVVDATHFSDVKKAVESAVINKFDTKKALKDTSTGITIEDTEMTCYVISGALNVRAGYSVNEAILGSLSYGDKVEVTGLVKDGKKDAGWYRISYNHAVGYVSDSFVSTDKPEVKETAITLSDEELDLYSHDGSATARIYKGSDGNWYDVDMKNYVAEGAGQWICSDGSAWVDAPVDNSASDTSSSNNSDITDIKLQNSNGEIAYIHQEDGDDTWMDNTQMVYTAQGAGQWEDENGELWSTIE